MRQPSDAKPGESSIPNEGRSNPQPFVALALNGLDVESRVLMPQRSVPCKTVGWSEVELSVSGRGSFRPVPLSCCFLRCFVQAIELSAFSQVGISMPERETNDFPENT